MYYLVVLLRIFVASLIFIRPLPAIILSVFFDLIDADFAHKVISKKFYQMIDKNLDLWWFINILIYSFFNYPDYRNYLLILFIYRLIGQLVYHFSRNRGVLLFFPNFFEWIFILIFLGKNYYPLILNGKTYLIITIIIFVLKIFQEWFLHAADLSIREDFFKIKRNWKK